MYFQKKNSKTLDMALFREPTNEYRGAPFWAWNGGLDKQELAWQIDLFQKMGFGGFNMHVRQGLEVDYLSDEFFDAVRFCAQKAQEKGMYAWAYDEDRWPSGNAGGKVTEDVRFRQRYLLHTVTPLARDTMDPQEALDQGVPLFLGAFSVSVSENGILTDFHRADKDASAQDMRYYYCITCMDGEPRFNGQTHSDNLQKACVDRFIQLTHQQYAEQVGQYFGGSIPAIFTDEPQNVYSQCLKSGFSLDDAMLPYTVDFSDSFLEAFGYDLRQRLPELFYTTASDAAKKTKHDYYRHVSQLFAESYMDNIGTWCEKNGVMLTGHCMAEDTLEHSTTASGYDIMRNYRKMQFPGIDCLLDETYFNTALQCRSVVNQYGKEGMLSELYGVTGWDFDLRGHKFQGDWQACLGVTLRCHHLAWQSMRGEGKRDYPASIFYQSPWYLDYRYLEDHYARLNTVLTRGKADIRTAVIHPIESYRLHRGADAESMDLCGEMDRRFAELAETMLTSFVDFDYLCEALLPELCPKATVPLQVGKMAYDTVIVSDCQTLRAHTVRLLQDFKAQGGKVIFIGNTPAYQDAVPSAQARALTEGAVSIPFDRGLIKAELAKLRRLDIRLENGLPAKGLMHTVRADGDVSWLFIAQAKKPEAPHISQRRRVVIRIRGLYTPTLFDTFTGNTVAPSYEHKNGDTLIDTHLYNSDSLLYRLEPTREPVCKRLPAQKPSRTALPVPYRVSYRLEEPNVLLLDMAQYRLDGGPWQDTEEINRIDKAVRQACGLPIRETKVVQPYARKDAPEDHTVDFRFIIQSEVTAENCRLVLEDPDKCRIFVNGKEVPNTPDGWYVDRYLHTVPIGTLMPGENEVLVSLRFGELVNIEAAYLTGLFGVKCYGRQPILCEMPQQLYFGSAAAQNLYFYGGNIVYETQFTLDEPGSVELEISHFGSPFVKATVDGARSQYIAFAPFTARFDDLGPGIHTLELTAFGSRYNTFSALHNLKADIPGQYIGPIYWRSQGQAFAYEYQNRPTGILKTPELRYVKE